MSLTINLTRDGSSLAVQFPNQTIQTIPANAQGMKLLVHILEAQQADREQRLGSRASPTQQSIEDFLKHGGEIKRLEPIHKTRRHALVKIADGIYKRVITAKPKPQDISTAELLAALDEAGE